MTPGQRAISGVAQGLLIHPAFVEPAVLAEVETLVGRVDDDGVVRQPGFVEVVENPAEIRINGSNAAQVVLEITLILPANQIFALEVLFTELFVFRVIGREPKLALLVR